MKAVSAMVAEFGNLSRAKQEKGIVDRELSKDKADRNHTREQSAAVYAALLHATRNPAEQGDSAALCRQSLFARLADKTKKDGKTFYTYAKQGFAMVKVPLLDRDGMTAQLREACRLLEFDDKDSDNPVRECKAGALSKLSGFLADCESDKDKDGSAAEFRKIAETVKPRAGREPRTGGTEAPKDSPNPVEGEPGLTSRPEGFATDPFIRMLAKMRGDAATDTVYKLSEVVAGHEEVEALIMSQLAAIRDSWSTSVEGFAKWEWFVDAVTHECSTHFTEARLEALQEAEAASKGEAKRKAEKLRKGGATPQEVEEALAGAA